VEAEIREVLTRRQRLKIWLGQRPRWLKWAVPIAVIILVLGLHLMGGGDSPPGVQVITLKPEDIVKTVNVSGNLAAVDEQSFFAPVDSTLVELKVKVGDRVHAGDRLGRLDTLELERKYREAAATLAEKEAALAKAAAASDDLNLRSAEAEYNRAKNAMARVQALQQAGAAAAQELEDAEVELTAREADYHEALANKQGGANLKQRDSLATQVELARQEVAQAREQLDQATFIAGLDGVVTSIGAQEGNRVAEGTLLMVVGGRQLKITANVNESDAGTLEPGQRVKITCFALPGKTFAGVVARVGAAAVKSESRIGEEYDVPVTVGLRGNTEDLKIGYTAALSIKTSIARNVIALPMEAISEHGSQKVVYVVQKDILHERVVKTRMGNEIKDIVVSGLKPGERIVPEPSPQLKDGDKVRIMPAQAGKPRS